MLQEPIYKFDETLISKLDFDTCAGLYNNPGAIPIIEKNWIKNKKILHIV